MLLCASLLLAGCGASGESAGGDAPSEDLHSQGSINVSSQEVPVDYVVPDLLPNIIVSPLGYEPSRDKIVMFDFSGPSYLDEDGNVVSAADGFTGTDPDIPSGTDPGGTSGNVSGAVPSKKELPPIPSICTLKNSVNDEALLQIRISPQPDGYYKADFSAFDTPGTYYIEASGYGRSVDFEIKDGIYTTLLDKCIEALAKIPPANDDIMSKCSNMYTILLSYELFPEMYPEGSLLKLFPAHSEYLENLDTAKYTSNELYFASAVLAKYSRLISEEDKEKSDAALDASTKIASVAALMEEDTTGYNALASIELYRVGGRPERLKVAEDYLGSIMEKELSGEDYLAVSSYLNTADKVDKDLSAQLMTKILRAGEVFAKESKENTFLVKDKPDSELPYALLDEASKLSVVNYVIKNHEYDTILLNHLHYLFGRNPKRFDYSEDILTTGKGLSLMMLLTVSSL